MNPNKRFAELAGIEWHRVAPNGLGYECSCGDRFWYLKNYKHVNPDFSDAREVLKVMMEREDFLDFITKICHLSTDGVSYDVQYDIKTFACYILNTTGLLRDEAIKWMEERNEASEPS